MEKKRIIEICLLQALGDVLCVAVLNMREATAHRTYAEDVDIKDINMSIGHKQ